MNNATAVINQLRALRSNIERQQQQVQTDRQQTKNNLSTWNQLAKDSQHQLSTATDQLNELKKAIQKNRAALNDINQLRKTLNDTQQHNEQQYQLLKRMQKNYDQLTIQVRQLEGQVAEIIVKEGWDISASSIYEHTLERIEFAKNDLSEQSDKVYDTAIKYHSPFFEPSYLSEELLTAVTQITESENPAETDKEQDEVERESDTDITQQTHKA